MQLSAIYYCLILSISFSITLSLANEKKHFISILSALIGPNYIAYNGINSSIRCSDKVFEEFKSDIDSFFKEVNVVPQAKRTINTSRERYPQSWVTREKDDSEGTILINKINFALFEQFKQQYQEKYTLTQINNSELKYIVRSDEWQKFINNVQEFCSKEQQNTFFDSAKKTPSMSYIIFNHFHYSPDIVMSEIKIETEGFDLRTVNTSIIAPTYDDIQTHSAYEKPTFDGANIDSKPK